MKINRLTFLGFQLNGALGSGRYDDIPMAQVKHHIRDGTILEFLRERLGDDLDLGVLEPLEKFNLAMEWADMEAALPDHKLGVEGHGLCLLMGYLLEGIQRRARVLTERAIASGLVDALDELDA